MKQTFKTLKQTNTIKIMNTTYSVAELQKMLVEAVRRERWAGVNTNKPTNICHLPDDILGMVEKRVLDIALKNKLNKQILRAHPDKLWSDECWSLNGDEICAPHSDYPEYYEESDFELCEIPGRIALCLTHIGIDWVVEGILPLMENSVHFRMNN